MICCHCAGVSFPAASLASLTLPRNSGNTIGRITNNAWSSCCQLIAEIPSDAWLNPFAASNAAMPSVVSPLDGSTPMTLTGTLWPGMLSVRKPSRILWPGMLSVPVELSSVGPGVGDGGTGVGPGGVGLGPGPGTGDCPTVVGFRTHASASVDMSQS